METLLYALAFFPPIILISLTVHEAGHLAAAMLAGIKPVSFQIGLGPKILAFYTGSTKIRIPEGQPLPAKGQLIRYWAAPPAEPGSTAQAAMWQPSLMGVKNRSKVYSQEQMREMVRQAGEMNRALPGFNARVKRVEGSLITVSDLEWKLAAIPVAAMVQVAEDPQHRAPNCFNTAKWTSQMLVIAAGPLANIALLGAVIIVMAAAPSSQQAIIVREVEPLSPAHHAGIVPGDIITRSGNRLFPSSQQLQEGIAQAKAANRSLAVTVSRQGKPLNLQVSPDPQSPRIGIAYEIGKTTSRTQESFTGRFMNLTENYARAVTGIFHHSGIAPRTGDNPSVTGIIYAGATAGQVVKAAGLPGFLAMLSAITISMALINMLPIPPLDGYQMLLRTLRAMKGGRPLNERVERAVALSGIAAIMTATIYLMYQDIAALIAQSPPAP